MMRRIVIAMCCCLLAMLPLTQVVFAADYADVSSITLNQVRQKAGELTMYVNLYDEAGFPVIGTYSPEQFAVSVDGVGASVDSVRSYDPSVQGIHYVFVVDVSLSMTDAMMESVRTSLNAYVDKMGPNDTVTVISFGEWVTLLLSESGDKETIKETISGIVPEQNWTALYESVIKAAQEAAGGRSSVIVITDGKNDLPDTSVSPTKEDIIAQLQSAQVPLYCIGLNDNNGVNQESLIELAEATGGAEFDGPTSNIGDSLDEIYGITCGAVELHATMTNPEGKSSFNEPSTFLVGFEAANDFITSNELQQVVNWTHVPGPDDLITPTPTARPKVTPPPTSAPTVVPQIEPEPKAGAEVASKPPAGLVVAGGVILVGVLVTLLLAGGRKKKKSDLPGETVRGVTDDDTKTIYDETYNQSLKCQQENTGFRTSDRLVETGPEHTGTNRGEKTFFLGQVTEETIYLDNAVTGEKHKEPDAKRWGISVSVEEEHAGKHTAEPKTLFLREGDAVVFGRTFPADVVINDEAVSRIHVKLSFDGERLSVCDLEATNGTIVNGEKLEKNEERYIRNGDELLIGVTRLRFLFGERVLS